MKVCVVLAAFLAVALCMSVPVPTQRKVHYDRKVAPPNWAMVARADVAQTHKFTVALKQRNLDLLSSTLEAVSDPEHEKYGQYLSIDEVLDIVSPPASDAQSVIDWLVQHGVSPKNILNLRDAIQVRATVGVAQELFKTRFYNFVHTQTGRLITRQMGQYSTPAALDMIEMVTGVSDFPPVRHRVKFAPAAESNVIPYTLWNVYNFPKGFGITTESSQSVAEFQNDASYNKDDLKEFYKEMGVASQPEPKIVGPYSGDYPDIEATLDYQYITAVGLNGTNWYWTETNWMYDFSIALFKADPAPMVTSMSWGWDEADQCSIDTDCSNMGVNSEQYVARVNVEFQKIGVRGLTLTCASGDSGVNGRTDPGCTSKTFQPIFPGGSPFVTTVGATQLNATKTSSTAEPVCKDMSCAVAGTECAVSFSVSGFTSGGGFSNYAATPDWQKDSVATFLKTGTDLPPTSYFNSSGRGYPDVAALGHNYIIMASGSNQPVGGTSAASPAFAGVIALLNDHRLKKGGKPLGFANPFLYKMAKEHPAAFNDVTCGSNACTEDGCSSSCKGFTASKGWDPVTGLGTPNLTEMLNYMDALDAKRMQKFGHL